MIKESIFGNEKPTNVDVVIVGEMNCCICGGVMTQTDVDNQQALLSTAESQIPVCKIIAHVNHFWDEEKRQHPADYELNIRKLALAVAKDRGGLTVEQIMEASAEIKELEKKYGK